MPKKRIKKRIRPIPIRVDKDAIPVEIEMPVVEQEEYRCTCCGHKFKKQRGNFNVSKSPIYKGNNGYTSICKKCISQLYDQYVKFFDKDEDSAMERICQIIDLPVDETAWDSSRKTHAETSRMSSYVAKLNLTQFNYGNTYADTLVKRWEAQVENAKTLKEIEENEDIETPIDAPRRFGLGFTDNEYISLQSIYDDWIEKYGTPVDKRQEELYISMCYLKLNLQRSTQSGNVNVSSIANAYKTFIEAATTEIEDRKRKAAAEERAKEQADQNLDPLGKMIKLIENHAPAEYYKDQKLYSDYDSIKDYITRFLTRPLANLLTGSKEMDPEFSLPPKET